MGARDNSSTEDIADSIHCDTLVTLRLTLIELCFGKTPQTCVDPKTNLLTAMRSMDFVYIEDGGHMEIKLGTACIARFICIILAERTLTLSNLMFEHVVKALAGDLDILNIALHRIEKIDMV